MKGKGQPQPQEGRANPTPKGQLQPHQRPIPTQEREGPTPTQKTNPNTKSQPSPREKMPTPHPREGRALTPRRKGPNLRKRRAAMWHAAVWHGAPLSRSAVVALLLDASFVICCFPKPDSGTSVTIRETPFEQVTTPLHVGCSACETKVKKKKNKNKKSANGFDHARP